MGCLFQNNSIDLDPSQDRSRSLRLFCKGKVSYSQRNMVTLNRIPGTLNLKFSIRLQVTFVTNYKSLFALNDAKFQNSEPADFAYF